MSRTQLANWYATQTPRDQLVLQVGGVVVALIIIVSVFLPLHRSLGEAQEKLQTQQRDLEWMRQVGPTLAAAGPGPKAATAESLVLLIDRSAREAGLAKALTGSQPAGKGAMRVQLDNADFNALVAWISQLSSRDGVRVESATITGGGNPGLVGATVQLQARQ